ncbi:MAG: NADPH:quinone reductase-like Zn-dependent oxidoreductase [Paracoccaceae bacterium]|jgi:NADPH:quinone reductase-like Zn-dependent oxidoreductase
MTLPLNMQAVLLRQGGYANDAIPASQVRQVDRWLEHGELSVPSAGADQVLIKVKAAMVNPSDLAFIQGGYGQPRVEGAAAGFEGVGEVIQGEGDYAKSLVGQRVSFVTNGSGTWAEYAVADAATVIPLRPDLRDEDGAALIVNPLTAAAMVDLVPEGGAFVASGAASQLGKLMAGLTEETGKRMIGLVRRDAPIEALKALGATEVLNETSESFAADLKAVLKAERPTVFLDCIAGAASAQVFAAMGKDSNWVIYGKMTPEAAEILEPGQLIFMRKKIEGFWLVSWMINTPIGDKMKAIQQVQARFADGRWKTDISARLPLRQMVQALPEALNKADGKVMIEIG